MYGDPEAYEVAFSFRDVAAEVDALVAWHRRLRGTDPGTALEVAAGPAAHAIELSRRGVAVTALDLSPAMCTLARRRAREAGTAVRVVRGDMVSFRLSHRYHLVVSMCDSAAHLHTLEEMVAHLRRVAAHLRPGGVYVVEMGHPAEFFGGAARTREHWRVRRDGLRADVRWTTSHMDPTTQVGEDEFRIVVEEGGRRRVLETRMRLRRWTSLELEAAVRMAGGLELVEQHGSFDPDAPFVGGEEEWRMISVFRKRGVAGRSRRR